MKHEAKIGDRMVAIDVSEAAEQALRQRGQPLLAEMELYFSCLIRKQVRFRDLADESDVVDAGEQLRIRFRPVMTAQCNVHDYEGEEPPLTDFPITRPDSYIPKWLRIDFRKGKWVGEFGYIN
ncbi:MAG: hypothetical protein ACWGOV_11730 [Acidiferrobacterales bacterium]